MTPVDLGELDGILVGDAIRWWGSLALIVGEAGESKRTAVKLSLTLLYVAKCTDIMAKLPDTATALRVSSPQPWLSPSCLI